MINVEELFEKGKLRFLASQKNKKKIIEYLLKCPNVKEALNYLDTKYLHEQDLEFYEIPIDGYMNLYDYILNTRPDKIKIKPEDYKNRSIYIPSILKNKSLRDIHPIIITTDMLLDKMPNGQTVLEYVLENDKYIDRQPCFEVNNEQIADILYKNKKLHLLRKPSKEILMYKIDNDKTLLEVLKEHNILPQSRYIAEDKNTGQMEFEYFHNIIFDKIEDKTILEILIEMGFNFKIQLMEELNDQKELEKLVNILQKYQSLTKIKHGSELFFNTIITHNNQEKRIIDIFKNEELPELIGEVKDINIIKRYIDARKYDTIIFCLKENTLLKEVENNLTVLDYIVNSAKENKCMLSVLKILERHKLLTPNITLLLSKYGLYVRSDYEKKIGIKNNPDLYSYIYKEADYQLDKEGESYIAKFKRAYNDRKSSKDVINTAIKSFKRTYIKDKELAIRDLTILIEMKKQYPNFTLQYNPSKGGCFVGPKNLFGFENPNSQINVNNKHNLETFNHELGHLVHFYCDEENTPQEIEELLRKTYLLDNEESKKLFEEINQEAEEQLETDEEYEKLFYEFIKEKYKSEENYHNEIKKDFKRLIGTKDLILEAINDGSYSEDVLKALVDLYYEQNCEIDKETLVELYVENRIKAEKQIFKNELYRKNNVEFLCYENFIDAFYMGGLYEYTKLLPKEEKEKLKAPMCTHNMEYFILGNKQFGEIYANYMELKKSPKGAFYIEKLKEKTSRKLIELLEEYDKKLQANISEIKNGKSR